MTYNYESLLDERFQMLCQTLLGLAYPRVQCVPVEMPDGGRDAVIVGKSGRGAIVYQVKYTRNPASVPDRAEWMIDAIKGELPKIATLAEEKRVERYVIMTNMPGTSHLDSGSIDKVQRYMDDNLSIQGQCLWRDDLDRRLDSHTELRLKYPGLISGEGRLVVIDQPVDEPNLLFRLYIPSERLYATEADQLLSLFHQWLIATRGHGVRQAGYRTAAGQMIEFFSDERDAGSVPDLYTQVDDFSRFLALCTTDQEAAVDLLSGYGLARAAGTDLVERFHREARRLELDMRHERQRRSLSLQHNIEAELVDNGVDLTELPKSEIAVLVERLVPRPMAAPLGLLAATPAERTAHVNVHINQQFIQATESTIINSVAGTLNLRPQPRDLLALIERFAGQEEAPLLQSAVYEFEDPDAPPTKRSAAKHRLKQFISQVTGVAKDVGTELLTKYLESKAGI